jgi:aromatic ring hydroxylase
MSHLKEVPDITDYPTLVNEHAIAIADWLQDLAESGDLRELLVVAETENGEYMARFTPSTDCVQRLGMIELVKADWLNETSGT